MLIFDQLRKDDRSLRTLAMVLLAGMLVLRQHQAFSRLVRNHQMFSRTPQEWSRVDHQRSRTTRSPASSTHPWQWRS